MIDELSMLKNILQRVDQVHSYLEDHDFPSSNDISSWYSFLTDLKKIQGNFNNDVSFLATLMAKEYLEVKYGVQNFDAAEKPQGAPGLDIDVQLPSGERLIAEIKTTYPYKQNDLGAQQKSSFKKDFTKLNNSGANVKIFFVTERKTFELMKETKYKSQIPGVIVVLLPTGEDFSE